jgi:hypothetical protein
MSTTSNLIRHCGIPNSDPENAQIDAHGFAGHAAEAGDARDAFKAAMRVLPVM